MRFAIIVPLAVAGALCVPAGNSFAQRSGVLEEIIVTAQKREESLQDVPLSISVFNGKSLDQDGVSNIQDIGKQTPGLVFSAFSVGQPEIAIRGVSTKEDGASASDSTVISVDDVYIAARTAQVFDIFDLERVEVARGPQGTLFGRNSIGGSINFVTLKPSQEKILRIQQTVGNHERYDTGFLVSGPVSDSLAAKISFSRRDNGGWLKNLLKGTEEGGSETYALRGQAVWTPRSDLELVATLDGAVDRIGETNREPIGSSGPLHNCGCASDPIAVNQALGGAGNPFTTLAETAGFADREVFGASLKMTWDFSNWASLVSITSYRNSDFNWQEDSEGLPPLNTHVNLLLPSAGPLLTSAATGGFPFDATNLATEEADQFTQELRLLSPGDRRLRWLAGLFYTYEDIKRVEGFNFPSLGFGPEGSNERSFQNNETNGTAFYAQIDYDIFEQLTVTLGGRYSYEKKEAAIGASLLNANPMGLLLAGAPFPDTNSDGVRDGLGQAEKSFNNITWRVALNYQFSDDINLYTNIATGFKSGGFAGSPSTLAGGTTPFKEEEATSYELGMKSRWLDNRVMVNASGFYIDYDDLQVTRFFQPIGSPFGEFLTENAGTAEIFGAELEFVAIPAVWLEIGGSYAYLDAEFTDFQGSPSFAADGTLLDSGFFNGKRLRTAPEHTASAYIKVNYTLRQGGLLEGKFKVSYQDDMFFDPDNNPINVSPDHTLVDIWAAYTTPDNRWEFKLWAKNLTDKEYVTHGFTQRGGRIAFGLFGEPRSYGGTVTFNFF